MWESEGLIVAKKPRKRDGAKELHCKHVYNERGKTDWDILLRKKGRTPNGGCP